MPRLGSWNFMLMGQGFLVTTQQSGPRGRDKLYFPNWGMVSAEHRLGRGSFMLQTMLSLDPATVTNRSYPLLFQTGETAYGKVSSTPNTRMTSLWELVSTTRIRSGKTRSSTHTMRPWETRPSVQ